MLPIMPEISMRLVSVAFSSIALGLFYLLAFRVSGSALVAFVSAVITSFLPAFIQRTQVLNVDVFLLIGWLGYALFYKRLYAGMFFLLVAVLSKSLLGYFPVVMIIGYELYVYFVFRDKKRTAELTYALQTMAIQVLISTVWFIWMYAQFRNDFVQYHIVDSHFKRVTASIEQHFGQRTYYLDIAVAQFRWFLLLVGGSLIAAAYEFFYKRRKNAFFAVLFFPWFIFLNLTKTKIAWYMYPVFPQLALLCAYPLRFIQNNWLKVGMGLALLVLFFRYISPINSFLTTDYSKWEDYQRIAQDAKTVGCMSLDVLVDTTTRTSYATLKSMDLVIHTTTWWGNHPSIAYYSDIPTEYAYTVDELNTRLAKRTQNSCFMIKTDEDIDVSAYRVLSKKGEYALMVKD
jgi:hypothetical protein